MAITRRAVLKTGVASVLIIGGTGAWLSTQTSRSAREPWKNAREGFGDPRLDVLAYAILAPNPHNMQPWQIHLDGDDAFRVFADPERLLPETDPPSRQITIGFGAFLELVRQAAAERGLRADIDPFPEGQPYPVLDDRPVAHVRLVPDAAVGRDPLFANALDRHTQRAPFDMTRPVDDDVLERVQAQSVSGVESGRSLDPALMSTLRELTADAWVAEWENDATRRESIHVTHIGSAEVSAKPWGISLDGPLLGTLGAVGLLSRPAMDTPGEVSYDETLATYQAACHSAMGYLWLSTPSNTRRAQVDTGAAWVRLHQGATREGLAFHPLSQALQEFPAMAVFYERIHALLAPAGHTLQMLARVGYAASATPSPRESLESKLVAV